MSYRSVYFVKPVGHDGPIKIGCSSDAQRRVSQLSWWSPIPLEIIASFPGSPADEHELHRRFAEYRIHGEWFARGEKLAEYLLDLPAVEFVRSAT